MDQNHGFANRQVTKRCLARSSVLGPNAWVIDDLGRVRVIDISEPKAPVEIEFPNRSKGEHDAGPVFEPVRAADLINGRVRPGSELD